MCTTLRFWGRLVVCAGLFLQGSVGLAQRRQPPAWFVDRGACPFECCTYQEWVTRRATVAFAKPDRRSAKVGVFRTGSHVRGLTGEVRSRPGKFVVSKAHGSYQPGDVLWVYTPQGEGYYKVWFNGRMYSEVLDYVAGPFERSYPSCKDTPDCWGQLVRNIRTEWWVKVRSGAGWTGWSDQPENFGDKDACG